MNMNGLSGVLWVTGWYFIGSCIGCALICWYLNTRADKELAAKRMARKAERARLRKPMLQTMNAHHAYRRILARINRVSKDGVTHLYIPEQDSLMLGPREEPRPVDAMVLQSLRKNGFTVLREHHKTASGNGHFMWVITW